MRTGEFQVELARAVSAYAVAAAEYDASQVGGFDDENPLGWHLMDFMMFLVAEFGFDAIAALSAATEQLALLLEPQQGQEADGGEHDEH